MSICAACGTENPDEARFCFACGRPLAATSASAREARKVVTVVFSDVASSTRIGERLDPEALRRVMSRYFDVSRAALERHGGTVEKFIGDAVMAVFGVPTLHEDDALRAVRAAAEMQDAVRALNDELEAAYAVRLETRIGVNTGEVVVGDGAEAQRLATGDAVNVAARLEQAAGQGEVFLGPETYRLVRDAVQVEALAPLSVKGKTEPLAAYRLVEVVADAPAFARRLETPLVGRERERRLLREASERSAAERACHLFTLLGPAGVGKSRLAAELVTDLGPEATVVTGRCLPYGEGITFWPLVELVSQLDVDTALTGIQDADAIQRRVAGVTGSVEPAGAPEETFWAVRKLFEAVARERPLVVVLDDLHWAEPTFLDLVEHVADWSRDAPLLLLCLARPELLELRPTWGGGKVNATSILLEPLSDAETAALIDALLGASALDEPTRTRIHAAAEGNPLFVEQMVAMVNEDGGGTEFAVPATIQALLAARLDRLPREERSAVERGAVEGKVFHQGAVRELTPLDRKDGVADSLLSLLRKQLIRPGESDFVGEQAFRFAHLLIRDAAYEALAKQERAELHERFADWLERAAGSKRGEYEEIIAYHLEQAYRYRAELGPVDDETRALGRRAADGLAGSGRRARARRDFPAAAGLLERAASLLPEEAPARVDALTELGLALSASGRFEEAGAVLAVAIERGAAIGEAALEARARVASAELRISTDPTVVFEALRDELEATAEVLERHADSLGLARAWRFLGALQFWLGNGASAQEAFAVAAAHAADADAAGEEADAAHWKAVAATFGSAPAPAALRVVSEAAAVQYDRRSRAAAVAVLGAHLEAMLGHTANARALAERGLAIAADLPPEVSLLGVIGHNLIPAELLGGRPEEAARIGSENVEALERMGETGFLSTSAALLAQVLAELGRDDDAERYSRLAEANASPDDSSSQMGWRAARAPLLARRGELDEAKRLAREAVEIAARTDFLNEHGAALVALGDVLARAGRAREAAEAYRGAVDLYERKENVVAAAQTRTRLAALEGAEV